MRLVDLTHSSVRRNRVSDVVPVLVKSPNQIYRIPLDRLVVMASVADLIERQDERFIGRLDVSAHGVSGFGGCILRTGWCDRRIAGDPSAPPVLTIDAAAVLLGAGVRTVAADFPLVGPAEDMLLHNHCVLVHCLSNISQLSKPVVRLVALPLKLEDTFCADARVIAIEE